MSTTPLTKSTDERDETTSSTARRAILQVLPFLLPS
jgi:hypothetical protein